MQETVEGRVRSRGEWTHVAVEGQPEGHGQARGILGKKSVSVLLDFYV